MELADEITINAPKDQVYAALNDPDVLQNIRRGGGRVRGTKTFNYYMIPNEPGEYDMGDYFSWIYFNVNKDDYDTLRSDYVLKVGGESRRDLAIASTDLGDFYNKIDWADNSISSLGGNSWMSMVLNILVSLIVLGTLYLLIKKPAA